MFWEVIWASFAGFLVGWSFFFCGAVVFLVLPFSKVCDRGGCVSSVAGLCSCGYAGCFCSVLPDFWPINFLPLVCQKKQSLACMWFDLVYGWVEFFRFDGFKEQV